ncbi:PEP-CTERM sorting domain-containing protein [Rubritalea spongiae]|uniref:PEP-CTERM sorting domain-containing protein n=1 Tax=Rubritalea spongiae TaxID=430797 RepID=A0ABW5DZ22_9BACT
MKINWYQTLLTTSFFTSLSLATTASAAILVDSYSYGVSPTSSYPDSGGELTDGVADVPTWGHDTTIRSGDTPPFVGWLNTNGSIEFFFDQDYTFGSVTIWVADSDNAAGVGLPNTITVSDANSSFTKTTTVTNPAGSGYMLPVTIDNLNVTTDELHVSFTRNHQWTMLTEVTFASVPEPSSSCLLGIGLTTLTLHRRRKTLR